MSINKRIDYIAISVIVLITIYGFNFISEIVKKSSSEINSNAKILETVKIEKVCFDSSAGITECIDVTNKVYNVLLYQENSNVVLYLKTK